MREIAELDYAPECERRRELRFGVTEAIAAAVTGLSGGLLSGGLATGIAGGLEGAAGGAALSGLTGGNPLTGALTGGISGGAIGGLGPAIGDATGLGATAGDIIAGGGGGLVGAELTGGNPLTGAATGALGGAAAGLSGAGSPAAPTPMADVPPTGAAGGGGSPAAIAGSAPSGIINPDLTGAGVAPGQTAFIGNITDASPISGGGGAVGGQAATMPISGGPSAGGGGPAPGTFYSPGTDTPVVPSAAIGTLNVPAAGGGIGGDIMSFIKSNPGVLLGGGLLASQLFKGNPTLPEEKQLRNQATNAQSTATALTSPLQTGILPPGAKAAVDTAANAAKAHVRSAYATAGLSGSTAESEALQAVDQRTAAQTFDIAKQLLSEGATYTQIADGLYKDLLANTLAQDQAFQANISRFAGALAGARAPTGG